MASPATPWADPVPPTADPSAIRACLHGGLREVFDSEWEAVLDEAKRTKELVGIRTLLAHWRLTSYSEMVAPGTYARIQQKAENILRTGVNDTADTAEDIHTLIQRRPAD